MQPLPKRQNDRMMFSPLVCISQILIYNQRAIDIPLTYLLHQHCACISINIISGLACVISKVLITDHLHIYYVFHVCYVLYNFPTRVFPWQGWRRGTICSTCQFHSLSNPRFRCYRSDRLYCSCVCKIKSCLWSKVRNIAKINRTAVYHFFSILHWSALHFGFLFYHFSS